MHRHGYSRHGHDRDAHDRHERDRHDHGGHAHDGGDRRSMRGGFGFGGRGLGGDHRPGGRGGRLGRVFEHGDLRYVLLHLIAERPRHGYELIKAIEEAFGGLYSPSPGVVYPTLTLVEELGYIRPESTEGSRKQFAITDEGRKFLDSNRNAVDAVLARMAEATRAFEGGPAPEIRRAVHNLELALSIRLGRGPLDAEQIRAVTTALDAAATAIERS